MKILIVYIQEAMVLNKNGIKKAKVVSEKSKTIEVPDYFSERLAAHTLAKEIFESVIRLGFPFLKPIQISFNRISNQASVVL